MKILMNVVLVLTSVMTKLVVLTLKDHLVVYVLMVILEMELPAKVSILKQQFRRSLIVYLNIFCPCEEHCWAAFPIYSQFSILSSGADGNLMRTQSSNLYDKYIKLKLKSYVFKNRQRTSKSTENISIRLRMFPQLSVLNALLMSIAAIQKMFALTLDYTLPAHELMAILAMELFA